MIQQLSVVFFTRATHADGGTDGHRYGSIRVTPSCCTYLLLTVRIFVFTNKRSVEREEMEETQESDGVSPTQGRGVRHY